MRSAIIGFVIGIAWLQNQAALPAGSTLWLLSFGAVLTTLAMRRLKRFDVITKLGIPTMLACGCIAGVVWASLFAQHYLARELPKEWEGRDITLIGTIDSLPYRFDQGVRFNFAVEQVLPIGATTPVVPPKLALSWYSGFRSEQSQTVGDVQPGARWRLTVRLQRPHGNANSNGFDYEVWLLEQDLRATGYVRPADDANTAISNRELDPFVVSIGNLVERARGALRDRIFAALPGREYAGVLVALVVGDQREVAQSDWKVFSRTGVSHLFSISGLHITMVAGLFAALMFALWRRSFFTRAQLPSILPAQKVAALAGAAMALVYVLLAGFGVPAQRTLYMLSVVAAALWFGRITRVSHVLCAALGVAVLLDPWAVLWPGFWLSFGAVAVILYASVGRTARRADAAPSRRQRWRRDIMAAAHTQYVVTLALVPLTMLLFGQMSLVSPIANAVAIPLVSFFVTPLALAGSILPAPLSGWVLNLAHLLVQWLVHGLAWLSALPAAVWAAAVPPVWVFVCASIGTLWLLAPRGWPARWFGLVGWVPLLLNAPTRPEAGTMWVTAFDVGQGMALLIETPQHRLLYDTGPFYGPESNGGNRVILPYLKARGITALDGVIVSHNDNDHSGGALTIFNEINTGWVLSSLKADSPIVQAAPHHRRCEAGQAWSWDGVQFEMLHPTAGSYDSQKWKSNARGCTLKISLGARSILLPADIEAIQEDELVGRDREKLHATVLLAPHHGSGTSSTLPFLQAVQPEVAVFQMGYRNRYGHPKAEVFERYRNLGIRRLRNDEAGAITLQFGSTLSISEYRTEHARYWYGQ
ncbi:DNA internalization-related competence protein ComEC/Rec2 [Undibacterium arcticum]|uniref:DNA internalization-related competence protein ComEC/Rec2 n=1 Tax=Undibacterium arcticum TaxID=1762892 RepID=A0ABV7F9N3_9BURK